MMIPIAAAALGLLLVVFWVVRRLGRYRDRELRHFDFDYAKSREFNEIKNRYTKGRPSGPYLKQVGPVGPSQSVISSFPILVPIKTVRLWRTGISRFPLGCALSRPVPPIA